MTSLCTQLPATILAGLKFQATLGLSDYPADEYTLTAVIRGPSVINLTATADGTDHKFEESAATTAEWAAGLYWCSLRATKDGDTEEVSRQQITIEADLAEQEAGYDGRTQNEIALDAINAVLARRATQDQERYTINNRELWRTPIPDLLKLKSFYAAAVRREKNSAAGSGTFGRAVHVRFK